MNNEYSADPLEQFRRWYDEAGTDVVALATATAEGAPSVRMVLLKEADERGFTFFTNYESRKGMELAENPRAAMLFHWSGRQVRVEGTVERIDDDESDEYWKTRPRGAQLAASVSRQSEPVASREALEVAADALDAATTGDLPRPENWGGYRLVPQTYEFWEHRDDRMHDRHRYRRDGGTWSTERLSP